MATLLLLTNDMHASAEILPALELLPHQVKVAQAEATALFDRAATILRPLAPRSAYSMQAAYTALAEHYRALNRSSDEVEFCRLAQGRTGATDSLARSAGSARPENRSRP